MLPKRFLPICALTGVLALIALAGYLIPTDAGPVPKRIAMFNTGGPVAFEHAKHVEYDESCLSCHHYRPGKQDWGHMEHTEDLDLECSMCHHMTEVPSKCEDCHTDGIVPSNVPFTKGTPPSYADAVHARCAQCHDDVFADKINGCNRCHMDEPPQDIAKGERLHKNMVEMTCSRCHLDSEGLQVPGMMDALHKSCIGCHEKMKAGPGAKDCGQCHSK